MSDEDRIESRATPGYFLSRKVVMDDFSLWFRSAQDLPSARDLPESGKEESREFMALWCVAYCAEWGLVAPDWAAREFARGWAAFDDFRAPSLSLAMGLPDRKRLGAMRNQVKRSWAAHHAFEIHHAKSVPTPAVFEIVGGIYGVSASYVEKDFYALVDELDAQQLLEPLVRMLRGGAVDAFEIEEGKRFWFVYSRIRSKRLSAATG